MSLNPTPPDTAGEGRLGNVVLWGCQPLSPEIRDTKGEQYFAANPNEAYRLRDAHNAAIAALTQALADLRRERDEFKVMLAEFILQMETSEGVDSDTWKAARLLIHNANKRAHRTPAPLPAPQRQDGHE